MKTILRLAALVLFGALLTAAHAQQAAGYLVLTNPFEPPAPPTSAVAIGPLNGTTIGVYQSGVSGGDTICLIGISENSQQINLDPPNNDNAILYEDAYGNGTGLDFYDEGSSIFPVGGAPGVNLGVPDKPFLSMWSQAYNIYGATPGTLVVASTSGAISTQANFYTSYLAGTAYTLTASSAAVTGGTTSPSVTLGAAGTYLMRASGTTIYSGATYAAPQTVTFILRRTNNTAGAIASATTTVQMRIVTTVTDNAGGFTIPDVIYTTANSTDIVTIYAQLSATPSVGSVQVTGAGITAQRLY